jgi:predicted Zn-dependent peptidase
MRSRPLAITLAAALAGTLLSTAVLAQAPARQAPPKPGPERPFSFPSHAETRLENGLTVLTVQDNRQPLVTATLMLPGAGSASHAGEKAGLAATTAGLLRQGTATRSAQEIAQAIDRIGGSLGAQAGADTTEVSLTVLATDLETGFGLLADVVQHPAFAAEELERSRRQTLSSLQVAYNDPEYLRSAVARRVAYGDHPYGHLSEGYPSTLRALSRDEVAAFHRERYTPAGSYLAIAGDIAPEVAVALARKHFGGWKGPATSPPQAPASAGQRRIVVIDKPDAVQTQFALTGAGVPRNHPDWVALSVANQVLGGDFNSRLNMRLRAKEGLTYGARTELQGERLAGSWGAMSFTRTEETARAIQLTLEVLRDFQKNPPTATELTEATSYLAGVFAIQTETAGGVANRVLTSALHGLPADYWRTYRERVRGMSAQDVAAAAVRHLDPERLSVVAVGNASGFATTLEPLGAVTVVPLARLDLTAPGLEARQEAAAGPEAGQKGLALMKALAEAAGGLPALAAVKDTTSRARITLSTPGGEMQGDAEVAVLYPDKVRVLFTLPAGEMVQVFDGSKGYLRMGPQPAMDLPAPMLDEMRRAVALHAGMGLVRDALEGRATVAALESKAVDGRTLERVSWTRDGLEVVLAIDPATHRIAVMTYRGMTPQGPAESEVRLDDYKPAAGGLTIPMRVTTFQNGEKVAETTITDFQVNTGLAADAFAKPQ